MYKALIVDDEESVLRSLGAILKMTDFGVTMVSTAEEALGLLKADSFDVLISDIRMSPMDGLQLLKAIHDSDIEVPVILVTGYAHLNIAVQALSLGAFDFLTKPVDISELRSTVKRAVAYSHASHGLVDLRLVVGPSHWYGTIVAESAPMRDVCMMIERLAPVETSVLITGEKGTGKTTVARAIHDRGPRREKRFLRIDCKCLDEFPFLHQGSEGESSRSTLLEAVRDGTLFLVNIDAVPPDQQEAMTEGLLELIDDENDRECPRLISSSCVDVEDMVVSGKFSSDLYTVIADTRVNISPLRERHQDILPFVYHFLQEKLGNEAEIPGIGLDVCAIFEGYSWPGNIHELRECLDHALEKDKKTIARSSLPENIVNSVPLDPVSVDLEKEFARAGFLKRYLTKEKKRILDTIKIRPDKKKEKGS